MKKILLPLAICGFIALPVLSYADVACPGVDVCNPNYKPPLANLFFDQDATSDPAAGLFQIYNCTAKPATIKSWYIDTDGHPETKSWDAHSCSKYDGTISTCGRGDCSNMYYYFAFSLDGGKTCAQSAKLRTDSVTWATGKTTSSSDVNFTFRIGLDPDNQAALIPLIKYDSTSGYANPVFTVGCPSG